MSENEKRLREFLDDVFEGRPVEYVQRSARMLDALLVGHTTDLAARDAEVARLTEALRLAHQERDSARAEALEEAATLLVQSSKDNDMEGRVSVGAALDRAATAIRALASSRTPTSERQCCARPDGRHQAECVHWSGQP